MSSETFFIRPEVLLELTSIKIFLKEFVDILKKRKIKAKVLKFSERMLFRKRSFFEFNLESSGKLL